MDARDVEDVVLHELHVRCCACHDRSDVYREYLEGEVLTLSCDEAAVGERVALEAFSLLDELLHRADLVSEFVCTWAVYCTLDLDPVLEPVEHRSDCEGITFHEFESSVVRLVDCEYLIFRAIAANHADVLCICISCEPCSVVDEICYCLTFLEFV